MIRSILILRGATGKIFREATNSASKKLEIGICCWMILKDPSKTTNKLSVIELKYIYCLLS